MNQEDERRAIFRGMWWKFSNYEITNGYIRPTKDATFKDYNPWDEYYRERFKNTKGTAPWQPLYNIGFEMELQKGNKEERYSEKVVQMILTFCKEYGLLGTLLHQTHQVVFPPRWEFVSGPLAERWQKAGMTYDEAWAERHIATLYRRDCFGGWAQVRNIPIDVDTTFVGERSCPSGVLFQPALDKPDLKMEEIRTTWARYFPDVQETDWEEYQTPVPSDPEFWKGYAEPVECFLSAAWLVFDLCQGLRADRTDREVDITEILIRLSTVTASIRPMFYYDKDNKEYRQGWKSPSLFGIVAMMLGTDLAGHYRFLSCPNCGYIFLTKSYQGKYCSKKCSNRCTKRRARQRVYPKKLKRSA